MIVDAAVLEVFLAVLEDLVLAVDVLVETVLGDVVTLEQLLEPLLVPLQGLRGRRRQVVRVVVLRIVDARRRPLGAGAAAGGPADLGGRRGSLGLLGGGHALEGAGGGLL